MSYAPLLWGRQCDPSRIGVAETPPPPPPNGPDHGLDMEVENPPPPPSSPFLPSEMDQTLKKPQKSHAVPRILPVAPTSPSLTPTFQCRATMGMHIPQVGT